MMTFDDVAELLAFCAVFDQRKGDTLDIDAWLLIANDHRWTKLAAMRVAREHYGSGGNKPRLDPAAITDRIRAMRSRAAESFEAPKIPDALPAREYPAWFRAQQATHIDEQLERWGETGQEPDRSQPVVLGRSLPELIASAPAHVRAELEAGYRRAGKAPR